MEEVNVDGMDSKLDIQKNTSGEFEPLIVMEFVVNAKRSAIEWMIAKLQAPQQKGGADLSVKAMVMQHNQETVLFIGAPTDRLLVAAEMMSLMKVYKDNYHREFTVRDMPNFKGGDDEDSFLTMAEKQMIIYHELENIRALEEDDYIPGYEHIKLYTGRTIVKKAISQQLIVNLFPLHDTEDLRRLGVEWYKKPFAAQPIEHVRHYFGEQVALYFAFLGFYTIALIPPAVIGVLYFVTSWKSMYREAIFAVFNLVWSTIFLEAWKRYCSELSFKWGTNDQVSSKFEEPQANYHGHMGKNPVTGKPEPVYPKWKRTLRFYGVTVPVLGLSLTVAFYAMLGYFILQDWADKRYADSKDWLNFLNLYIPTIIYAIVIGIVNTIYRKVAKLLNDFENHRLQMSYDNHLIVKLILFDFVNCFISLFYVAFYMQDMTILKSHLAALLITQQLVGQIRESVVPFIFQSRRNSKLNKAMTKVASLQNVEFLNGQVSEEVQKQASVESTMEVYEGTMDDYLEMFLQFGYVFLFSSVFPLAALWALVNNITEIRSDAFKMCRVFQRPFAESASNIGAWQIAFELISAMAVMTNCALIGMDPEVQKLLPSDISAVNIILIFVAVEHILLMVKVAVAYIIPDMPKWVQIEVARIAYQSRLALQKNRINVPNIYAFRERRSSSSSEAYKTAGERIYDLINEEIEAVLHLPTDITT